MASIFSFFKRGLEKSATKISRAIAGVFTGIKAHGDSSFEDLEAMLVAADFGLKAATEVTACLKDRYERGEIATDADLVEAAKQEVSAILKQHAREINLAPQGNPTVILFVGVNGSGKTTTIGKLATRLHKEGKKVILAACDTFRAAAVEQLQLWGERSQCQVVSSRHGADPASVAFDATQAALARNADFLLIDTAGRQQNHRDAPHEVWLTVDSSLGANVVNQAREFSKIAGVTGLVLTKLDGTGRGGMAVALHREFELPTFFTGLGEQPDELQPFDPELYAEALFAPRGE